jgi:4-hydroxyphenylpyruvate dioxygenase
MTLSRNPLALHAWTLDSTPLARVLEVARATGWDAVELRRIEFDRAAEQGVSEAQVLELVRQSGLAVAAVGAANGWMYATGDERVALLRTFESSCAAAAALECATVMSPVDRAAGDVRVAADSVREVGDIAARYGVRLALEFGCTAPQYNTLESVREVLGAAAHPACGLLLDTYHLHRTGGDFADVGLDEIAYVQFSDVPASGLEPDKAIPRLCPGDGVVDFRAMFALLDEKGYTGALSYEAPNPAAWERDPTEVAQEALTATKAILSGSVQQTAT